MKLFPVVIRRIGAASAGFIASVINAGVSFANRFTLLGGTVNPAIAIDITRQEFRGPTQAPAISMALLGATGTAANEGQTPAVDVDASLRDVAATSTQQSPAFSAALLGASGTAAKPEATPAFLTTLLGATGDTAKPAHTPAMTVDAGRNTLQALSTLANPAFTAVQSLYDIAATTFQQTPAFLTSLIAATGTAAKPAHTPAMSVDASRNTLQALSTEGKPACDIQQVTYNLTRLVGANATADFDTAWTNQPNATGLNDGVFATAVGAALAKTQTIELSYLDHVLKGELTITAATVRVYMKVTDAVVPLCTVTLSYNLGAGLVNLEAPFTTANGFDNTVTPRVYTIPLDTWTEYNALQVRVKCAFAALAALSNASLDAVTIEIVANKTDTL